MFFLTFLEVHFSAQFTIIQDNSPLSNRPSFFPEKWNILQTFPAHGYKDPKSTFTLIKGRPDQTEREGRQGENYSFDEENMRRGLDVMGRVT